MVSGYVLFGQILLCFGVLLRCAVCAYPWVPGRFRHILLLLVCLSWGGLGFWLALRPSIIGFIIAYIEIYQSLNVLRLVEQRMHRKYLEKSVRKTWQILSVMEVATLIMWWLYGHMTVVRADVLSNWIAYILLVASVGLALVTFKNIQKTRFVAVKAHYSDKLLPTVTLAMPARNETDLLTSALECAVASTYPKLEILVLDDCSHGKTPEIIRSFAHDGVRFIEGTAAPADHWLAKNWAYQTLYDNSSGEILLFAGVDARFEPDTIRTIVTNMIERNIEMMSFMPYRGRNKLRGDLIHPLRNWWELVLPRKLLDRPAVLSTTWAIRRKSLKKLGAFKAVTRFVIPERYFARELSHHGAFRFYRSRKNLGLSYVKGWREQLQTAVRTRYPEVHKRPEWVALIGFLEFVFWLVPFGMLVYGHARLMSLMTIVILTAVHCSIEALTNERRWWLGIVNFPMLVVLEIILLNKSMYKYEFSEVQWKERNICLPVMHVTPRLPEI